MFISGAAAASHEEVDTVNLKRPNAVATRRATGPESPFYKDPGECSSNGIGEIERVTKAEAQDDLYAPAEDAGEELTDEQLARKLQAEWDKQDQTQRGEANETASSALECPSEPKKEPPDKTPDSEPSNERPQAPEEAVSGRVSDNAFATFGKKSTLALQSATADDDATSYTVPFDQSPLTFSPEDYLPDLKRHWAVENNNATYALLTHCFVLVNSTQSRIKIVEKKPGAPTTKMRSSVSG